MLITLSLISSILLNIILIIILIIFYRKRRLENSGKCKHILKDVDETYLKSDYEYTGYNGFGGYYTHYNYFAIKSQCIKCDEVFHRKIKKLKI